MSSTLSKNIKTYIDGFALLERQRDAIARPSIDLDDPLWLQFILRTKDKSPKIRALLKIVDNYAFDLRSERSQDIRYQIMGERSLRLHALNEQPNSRPTLSSTNITKTMSSLPRKTTQPLLLGNIAQT
jgi:hypothetical protein